MIKIQAASLMPTSDVFITDKWLFERSIGNYLPVDVSPDQLSKKPFLNLTRPSSPGTLEGFTELRTLAMVQVVLLRELGEIHRNSYRIVGYSVNFVSSSTYQLVILVERVSTN